MQPQQPPPGPPAASATQPWPAVPALPTTPTVRPAPLTAGAILLIAASVCEIALSCGNFFFAFWLQSAGLVDPQGASDYVKLVVGILAGAGPGLALVPFVLRGNGVARILTFVYGGLAAVYALWQAYYGFDRIETFRLPIALELVVALGLLAGPLILAAMACLAVPSAGRYRV